MAQLDETARRLAAMPLFAPLPASLHEELAAEAISRSVRGGRRLWRAGDPAVSFTVVERGLVAIMRRTASGEEAMLGLFGPRETIGLPAVLQRAGYPADAVVLSKEARVLQVRAEPFLARMDREPALAMAFNRELLRHNSALQSKIEVMSNGPVPQRLAAVFEHLAERFGDEDEGGAVTVPIAMTRAQLAQVVGARVETVSRVLGKWQREGWLVMASDGITVLRPGRLEELYRGQ